MKNNRLQTVNLENLTVGFHRDRLHTSQPHRLFEGQSKGILRIPNPKMCDNGLRSNLKIYPSGNQHPGEGRFTTSQFTGKWHFKDENSKIKSLAIKMSHRAKL